MKQFLHPSFFLLFLLNAFPLHINAQSHIKVGDMKINFVDKQKRKQGEWIFFDHKGNIKMSCFFKDDLCNSPQVFYENKDTVFVLLKTSDSTDAFVLYKDQQKYYGNFIKTSDSSSTIEVDAETLSNALVVVEIKRYQKLVIGPVYFFAQQKMKDYISASFTGSDFTFNKPLQVLLTINGAGFVTKVEFPAGNNNLTGDEERELHWIYSRMPRWQPYFYRNCTKEVKILLTNNATLSVM